MKNSKGKKKTVEREGERERAREGKRDKFDRPGQIANKIGVRRDGPTRT